MKGCTDMTTIRNINDTLVGQKYKPGMKFDFSIAVPETSVDEYALLVEHDGQNDANINSMLALADEGKAPYCIGVGVHSGYLAMPDGSFRGMRMNSYDLFDREYADFIVFELIPYIEEKYKLKLSHSPDMHFVCGGSSGGISAFAMAWFHPEYFHRVYMTSPSFLAMGRGNELPYLIRKYETKPLRIYQEMSENEPNDYFGWSRGIDEETDAALIFAGYDYRSAYFEGEGHSSRYRNVDEAYKRNEWIWKDWQTKPIAARSNSPRVDRVIPFGSKWGSCPSFPEKRSVKIPDALRSYHRVVLSNDGLAWYAANKNDDIVSMYVADNEVSLDRSLLHATLHTIPRFYPKGAIDMVVDGNDRLYVLTSIGIQCVRSFGLIDVILELPDDSTPVAINITDALYVKTEKGVYRRELCSDCTEFDAPRRCYTGYYD
jgi:hypothetical protein